MMLQVLSSPVLTTNAPSWSLHYEVLFYLFFIPVSFLRFKPIPVWLTSFIARVGLLLFSSWAWAPLITSYLFGFSFWSLGLVIASFSRSDVTLYSNTKLISAFLLFFSLEQTNQLHTLLVKVIQFFSKYSMGLPR